MNVRCLCSSLVLIIISWLLLSCASVKSYSEPNHEIAGKKLGVLAFYSDIPGIGITVSDTVAANLIDSGSMVIEREYLDGILREHGYSQAGVTQSPDYREIGRISKVDYLLVGSVDAKRVKAGTCCFGAGGGESTHMSGAIARIIDVNTGEVVLSVTVDAQRGSTASSQPVAIGELIAKQIKIEIAGDKKQGMPCLCGLPIQWK